MCVCISIYVYEGHLNNQPTMFEDIYMRVIQIINYICVCVFVQGSFKKLTKNVCVYIYIYIYIYMCVCV